MVTENASGGASGRRRRTAGAAAAAANNDPTASSPRDPGPEQQLPGDQPPGNAGEPEPATDGEDAAGAVGKPDPEKQPAGPATTAADGSIKIGSLSFDMADADVQNLRFKGLIFGQSGSGKTWLAATAPSPFILLTEENGRQSIRQSNRTARVQKCTDIGAVREFIKLAAEDRLAALGCKTIVIDSLTEVQRLMKDEIMAKKPKGEVFSLQDWGELTEKMRRFMRMLRDVPYNVVAVCLENTHDDGEDGPRTYFPMFEGKKLANEVAQYFNFVGYTFKRERNGADGVKVIEHACMLEGPSRYLVKPCSPLTGVLQGPMSVWFDRLAAGTVEPTK